jgi:hypothetical protein
VCSDDASSVAFAEDARSGLALPGAAPLDRGLKPFLLDAAPDAPDLRDLKLLVTEKVPLSAVPARFMNRTSSAADF